MKSWDKTFMEIAHTIALRSKDPSTKIGAVITDENNRIVSVGFNGPPRKIDDNIIPWTLRPDKYNWIIHAEVNAVLFAKANLIGYRCYVTGIPCPSCMLVLIQYGIVEVIYDSVMPRCCEDTIQISETLASAASVKLRSL